MLATDIMQAQEENTQLVDNFESNKYSLFTQTMAQHPKHSNWSIQTKHTSETKQHWRHIKYMYFSSSLGDTSVMC